MNWPYSEPFIEESEMIWIYLVSEPPKDDAEYGLDSNAS